MPLPEPDTALQEPEILVELNDIDAIVTLADALGDPDVAHLAIQIGRQASALKEAIRISANMRLAELQASSWATEVAHWRAELDRWVEHPLHQPQADTHQPLTLLQAA